MTAVAFDTLRFSQRLVEAGVSPAQVAGTFGSDIATLKTDVAVSKTDVAELTADLADLKSGMAGRKADLTVLRTDSGSFRREALDEMGKSSSRA